MTASMLVAALWALWSIVAPEGSAEAVAEAASRHGVPVALVAAVCVQESTWGRVGSLPCGCDPSGAHGVGPSWESQARCAARSLATSLRRCRNVRGALARYQSGSCRGSRRDRGREAMGYARRVLRTARMIGHAAGVGRRGS